MKDLLTVATPAFGNTLGSAASYALAAAGLSGAHLTALIGEIEPVSADLPAEPDNMQGASQWVEPLSAAERLARTAELIEAAAKSANVPLTLLLDGSGSVSLREMLIDNAQVRDLVMLGVRGPLRHPRQGLVEAVLFGTGRPIVLVPAAASPLADGRVLVAWDATPSAVRALHDALPLLTRARDVVIVSVANDKEFRSPHSGTDLCRYLARWGVDARYESVTRERQTVGAALQDFARRIEATLLVMGGFGHAREREFIFGSATRDIFQSNLELPVLLSH